MKFARKFAEKARGATAAPAVHIRKKLGAARGGFTLLELMVVIAIIGILSGLAYSSLIDLIFTNRAKESAQVMRAFAERAMAEAKRQEKNIEIKLEGNSIKADFGGGTQPPMSELLSGGFQQSKTNAPNCINPVSSFAFFNDGAISTPKIGISSIAAGEQSEGYFVACGAKDYCAAAVKTGRKNTFIACIKKGGSTNWEAL